MSRGNQQTLAFESSMPPQNRLSQAVMQHRNRGRSIQSAGKPYGYLQYPGQLPTLGLNKYKNVEINNGDSTKNPLSIQKETEKMLIARERERENKDLNRVQNNVLRVYQKSIKTRANRAGVIREINDIKPSKGSKYSTENQLMLMNASHDDQQQQQNKKLNIFDENDSSLLKHETLARLGFEARGAIMSAVDEDSETKSLRSQHSSQTQLAFQKPKALEYLQKGREQKESTREFILNARNILISQIAINDKTEETERLKEYIIMEKEKLEEAKKTFDEDKDKFQKYMDDLNRKAEETALDVQRLTNEKNERMEKIQQLQINIQKKKSKIKQIDEKLVVFKQHKYFLDTLAISAGKKQPRTAAQRAELGLEGKAEVQMRQTRAQKKEASGNFFLTQTNQQNPHGVRQKTSMDKQDPENEDAALQDEDDDFEIYFDKFTLLEHLSHLEEDNLFKIHLVQEDEQALDKLKRSIDYKIEMKETEIEDVKANIEMLLSSMNQLINKQQFLDQTMRVKQNSNQQNQLNTSKGGHQNDMSRISNTIQDSYNDKGSALQMLQQMTGCSKEQITKLSTLISQLLEKAGIKQEDQSDKIEMLRKIDYKLEQLVEVREYIHQGEKKKELEDKEKELHMIRKEENIKKKKAIEDKKLEEGQRKNRERIRKQEQFKIFRGRKEMQRAKKADLKPKEKNDDKPSQEVLDQQRYLGGKIFEDERK
ncbi:UNKNOWN [Stylonychia lemnae]|uniref:DUF4200 domain-containing protein n=1 Tax=Stylonychia lemnae TaxID=5949 RepID=A0A078AMH3_STYLE|nr:UNKNOWN [Stylonychia lemnae]|eukprot:CDW82053.1 UNKNOWN [Stylonychia lemnae]